MEYTTQLNMLKASVWEKHSQELFPYKSSTFGFPFHYILSHWTLEVGFDDCNLTMSCDLF
jgi:hypothetical protein